MTPDQFVLPHDLDVERTVIGAAIIGDAARGVLVDRGITERDFYVPANAVLWRAMTVCDAAGHPVDSSTVADTVRRHPDWLAGAAVSGDEVRSALLNAPMSVSVLEIDRHAEILRDFADRRRLIQASFTTIADASAGARPAGELLAEAEQRLLGTTASDAHGLVTIATDAIEAAIPDWERPTTFRGTATGLHTLDGLLRGMRPGQLVVLGARPAMGKSTLALDIARHVGIRGNRPVLIASLEMSGEELAGRLVAAEGAIPGRRLTHDGASPEHWDRVIEISSDPRVRNVMWTDQSDLSATDIAALARRVAARQPQGLGLLVVDYLQLLRPADPRAPKVAQVAEMSRGLKILARAVGAPVLALSQLSRANESRINKRPILSDLRDSGSVEQDADTVVFLHREDYYNEDAPPGISEAIVAKNRNGPTGTAQLLFQASFPRFVTPPRHVDTPRPLAPPPAGGVPLPDHSRT